MLYEVYYHHTYSSLLIICHSAAIFFFISTLFCSCMPGSSKHVVKSAHPSKSFSISLDVRGKNIEEAWMDIDKYLDEAMLTGLHTVRLIHGKGTGALRAGVQQYLKSDPRIRTFRLGTFGEGENGVTIAEIK